MSGPQTVQQRYATCYSEQESGEDKGNQDICYNFSIFNIYTRNET